MPTSSAVPADLFTYSNSCVGMDDQLQTLAVHSLGPALDAYRLRCSTFPISHSSGPGIQHGGDGYTHGYGTAFSLAGELTQYAVTNHNIDSRVGQVATAFLQASRGQDDPSTPAQIAALQRDQSKPSGPIDDTTLNAMLNPRESLHDTALNAGLSLAAQINGDVASQMSANGYVTLSDQELSDLESHAGDPFFALALLNTLSPQAQSILDSYLTGTGSANDSGAVAQLFTSAYGTGDMRRDVTQQLYQDLVASGRGPDADQALMAALASNPAAAAAFVNGLNPDQIQNWSTTDQGFFASNGPFERMAVVAVNGSWQGYANPAQYSGPLSQAQLAALMFAATRDDPGRAAVTDSMGQWFIDHGGRLHGSSPADVAAWVGPLTNMNGAIATPTGAYLQNIEAWIQGGKVIAGTAAVLAGGYALDGLVLTPIWEAAAADISAEVGAAIADSTFAAAWKAGLTFEDSLGAGLTSGSKGFLDAANVLRHAHDFYEWTDRIRKGGEELGKAIDAMSASDGVKSELTYYFAIMNSTYHEAVARLLQQGEIVTKAGKLVPWTADDVNMVMNDASNYYIGSATYSFDVGPPTPVTVVCASIYGQFMSTH
jgi:hypothetical protein